MCRLVEHRGDLEPADRGVPEHLRESISVRCRGEQLAEPRVLVVVAGHDQRVALATRTWPGVRRHRSFVASTDAAGKVGPGSAPTFPRWPSGPVGQDGWQPHDPGSLWWWR